MVSKDEDKIDFGKLEKELNAAVESDARYWDNDAKFRAVNQKVATYEEFRDIVAAAHIKPLEKGDRLHQVSFTQPWNSQASTDKTATTGPGDGSKQDNLQMADNQAMFQLVRSLGGQTTDIIPEIDPSDPSNCCNQFSNFFVNKMQKMRTGLDMNWHNDAVLLEQPCFIVPLSSLKPPSSQSEQNLVAGPLPAKQLKQPVPAVCCAGRDHDHQHVTSLEKRAVIAERGTSASTHKKPSLDQDMLKNTDLSLVSTVLEK